MPNAAKILTAVALRNLRPGAERYEVPDHGCAGLRVVVHPSGRMSWIVRFRFRGLPRKLTLGGVLLGAQAEPDTAPELDTPLSLAAARQLATRELRQAKSGADPTAAKRKRRELERAQRDPADTLKAVAEEFLRREGDRLRSKAYRRADLELLYPTLGPLPIDQIRRGQYSRVLDHVADTRGPVRSDRVLAALSRLLTWHAKRSDFVSPLARGMRRTNQQERARSRFLSDDELRKVWTTAATFPAPFGPYLQFLLLTATRRNEAAGLRRSELSPDGKSWLIPGARYKTGLDTLIPLSAAAQKIVTAQPQLGEFVFTATGANAFADFAAAKRAFDQACGVTDWRLHDLRRTSRTLLSRAGISADVAERCLGHALTGVRATYDRHSFEQEKRHAFEALAQLVERIVNPPPGGVVPLRGRR